MYTSFNKALAFKPWTWENQYRFDKSFEVQILLHTEAPKEYYPYPTSLSDTYLLNESHYLFTCKLLRDDDTKKFKSMSNVSNANLALSLVLLNGRSLYNTIPSSVMAGCLLEKVMLVEVLAGADRML
jgi:hypothetical protein